MANILIINSGKDYFGSKGELNKFLTQVAVAKLRQMGHETKETHVDEGYDLKEEVQKIFWADSIIYQQPSWWMGGPWILKKYMDEVFSEGDGILYQDDGRTRSDVTKKYGSGGLVQGKTYMVSCTWNAPYEAFVDPEQFFDGVGVDGVYFPFHKANQFLGMKPLETFVCCDVVKNTDVEKNKRDFQRHLEKMYNVASL